MGEHRADLIINGSNDGWFGDVRWSPVSSDAGREQHLLAARWRCIELGVPMVRAVNTGISAAVDSKGRVLSPEVVAGLEHPTGTDGAFVVTVPLGGPDTIFGRIGNVFGWSAMVVGWVLFAAAWTRARAERTGEESGRIAPAPAKTDRSPGRTGSTWRSAE